MANPNTDVTESDDLSITYAAKDFLESANKSSRYMKAVRSVLSAVVAATQIEVFDANSTSCESRPWAAPEAPKPPVTGAAQG